LHRQGGAQHTRLGHCFIMDVEAAKLLYSIRDFPFFFISVREKREKAIEKSKVDHRGRGIQAINRLAATEIVEERAEKKFRGAI
jgi:hypothetical protein